MSYKAKGQWWVFPFHSKKEKRIPFDFFSFIIVFILYRKAHINNLLIHQAKTRRYMVIFVFGSSLSSLLKSFKIWWLKRCGRFSKLFCYRHLVISKKNLVATMSRCNIFFNWVQFLILILTNINRMSNFGGMFGLIRHLRGVPVTSLMECLATQFLFQLFK